MGSTQQKLGPTRVKMLALLVKPPQESLDSSENGPTLLSQNVIVLSFLLDLIHNVSPSI